MKKTISFLLLETVILTVIATVVPIIAQNKKVTAVEKRNSLKRDLGKLWFAAQARADGEDSVYYINGSAYSYIQGERSIKLFDIEGYNVRRRIETPEKDGYFIATREVVFYKDPKTGEILTDWQNPLTNEKNEVFHIANDPVNFRYRIKNGKYIGVSVDGKREYGEQSAPDRWNGFYVWHADVFPFYKLPEIEKSYSASEMFDFYVPQSDADKKTAPQVMVSWTRVSPWLPWMNMGGREGTMVIHARSVRYESWSSLPNNLKSAVREKFPLYLTAPDKVDPDKPNATSWTVYYKELRKRREQ